MKTAISVPERTYYEATRRAAEMGISRSEFFARAAQRYLDELDAASVTGLIDEALAGGLEESSADAAPAGRRRLRGVDDW
jgi:metal-responsive CopG/Arc/MetJ family transcriptional regulator